MASDPLLSYRQAAALANVHPTTVRRAVARGVLPCVDVGGSLHCRRIRQSDLERWINGEKVEVKA